MYTTLSANLMYLMKWLVRLDQGGESGKDQIGQPGECSSFTQQLNGQNEMCTVSVARNEASVVLANSRTDLKSNTKVCFLL